MTRKGQVATRSPSLRHLLRLLASLALLLALGGCMRGCASPFSPIHLNPNMDRQPKYLPQAESEFFYDGATMRLPLPGTVARGELNEDTAFYQGVDEAGQHVAAIPLPVDESLIARGGERYGIYCTPCHAENGNGRGVLWERAQIEAGNLHDPRMVAMPVGEMFDVITNGVGLMAGYAYPIPPRDRWAIIAYVRQMQQEGGS